MNQEFECFVHCISGGYAASECRSVTEPGRVEYLEIRTDNFLEHERLEVREGSTFTWTIRDGQHEMRLKPEGMMSYGYRRR
jgi:hypothetical protein